MITYHCFLGPPCSAHDGSVLKTGDSSAAPPQQPASGPMQSTLPTPQITFEACNAEKGADVQTGAVSGAVSASQAGPSCPV